MTFSDLSYTTAITNSTCGASNGSIVFTAIDGVLPYTYSIDNNVTTQITDNFTGLVAGPYPSIVEDALGCQVSTTETVNNSGGPVIDAVAVTDPLCSGICNGSITVTVSGGSLPYTFSVNGGTPQTSNTITGLCDGVSSILVEDNNLCQVIGSTTLTDPTPVTFTSNFVDPLCFGNGGSINLFPSGGSVVADYNYTLDDGINAPINQTNGAFSLAYLVAHLISALQMIMDAYLQEAKLSLNLPLSALPLIQQLLPAALAFAMEVHKYRVLEVL